MKNPRHGKIPIGAYYSPGTFNDGGGIIIYLGHDGKIHIKRVPPSQPLIEGLGIVANLVAQAEKISDQEIRQQLYELAERIGDSTLQAITVELEE